MTFVDEVTGTGSFAGTIGFHAGYNPGNSPASVNFNGADVTFDATAVLTMEMFGSTPGTQYDRLLGIGKLTFNGRLVLDFGHGFGATQGAA